MNRQNIPLQIIIDSSDTERHFVFNLRDDIMHGNIEEDDLLGLTSELLSDILSTLNNDSQPEEKTIKIKPIKYSEIDKKYSQTECAICLQEFENDNEVYQLECHHIYHKSCLDQWFSRQNSCPLCKNNIC